MNNLRRRSSSGKELVLTASTYSFSFTPSNGSKSVTIYANGVNISSSSALIVSSKPTWAGYSNGYVSCSSQNGNTTSRTGNIILTYLGKTLTLKITLLKDYQTKTLYRCSNVTLNLVGPSSSYYYNVSGTIYLNADITITIPIKVTVSYANYNVYASGYSQKISGTNVTNESQTITYQILDHSTTYTYVSTMPLVISLPVEGLFSSNFSSYGYMLSYSASTGTKASVTQLLGYINSGGTTSTTAITDAVLTMNSDGSISYLIDENLG